MLKYFLSHYFHIFFFFSIFLLIFLLYKIELFKEIFETIKKNKFFFLILLIIASIISLKCFPFSPLVYFDEHNYLIEAQNIVENNINSLCLIEDKGECKSYGIAPHGLGLSSIYALFYHYDFVTFYRNISFFTLFLYLLNAISIFIISERIFLNKNISQLSSILILTIPYNLIYATNVMPATICNTLFLISIYCGINLFTSQNLYMKKYSVFSLLLALFILSSFKIEYSIIISLILLLLLLIFLSKITNVIDDTNAKERISRLYFKIIEFFRLSFKSIYDKLLWGFILLMIIISYSYSFFYFGQKLGGEAALGIGFINASYFYYYVSSVPFIILTVCFGFYLFYFFIREIHLTKNQINNLKIILVIFFFIFISLYSFYNYFSVYRYMIPITSIYILFSSAGLYLIIKMMLKKKKVVYLISIIILIILSFFLVQFSFIEKKRLIERNSFNAYFIEIINKSNINHFEKLSQNNYYYFAPSYLGKITRMRNYINSNDYAKKILERGDNLYYINNPFETISNSYFNDSKKFSYELVLDAKHNYNIYKIYSKE